MVHAVEKHAPSVRRYIVMGWLISPGLQHAALSVADVAKSARWYRNDDGPHDIPPSAILNFKDQDGIALALFWAR